MADLELKKPETGSAWTWKKGKPPWEVEVVVKEVVYCQFDWQVRVERADGNRFEDGLPHFEVPLYKFLENASQDDIEDEFLKLSED